MRKLTFLLLIFTLGIFVSKAQDIIVLQTKEQIQVKLFEVTNSEVVYKMFDKPDGPVYRIKTSVVKEIKFQNQEKDAISYRKEASSQQTVGVNATGPKAPIKQAYIFGSLGYPITNGVVKETFLDKLNTINSVFTLSAGLGVEVEEGFGIMFLYNKCYYGGAINLIDLYVDNSFWGIGAQFSAGIGENIRCNVYTLYGRSGYEIGRQNTARNASFQSVSPSKVTIGDLGTIMIGANMRIPANTPLAFIPGWSWQNTFSTNENLSTLIISAGIGINIGLR